MKNRSCNDLATKDLLNKCNSMDKKTYNVSDRVKLTLCVLWAVASGYLFVVDKMLCCISRNHGTKFFEKIVSSISTEA